MLDGFQLDVVEWLDSRDNHLINWKDGATENAQAGAPAPAAAAAAAAASCSTASSPHGARGSAKRKVRVAVSPATKRSITESRPMLKALVRDLRAVKAKFRWQPRHIVAECTQADTPQDWEALVKQQLNMFFQNMN